MNNELDYNLLRPFDLEAAKQGFGVLWSKKPVRWVALSDDNNFNIIEHSVGLSYATKDQLKMAPLSWVESRPVYKGDTLYFKEETVDPGKAFVVYSIDGTLAFSSIDEVATIKNLTWTQPNPILCEVQGKPVRKGDLLWSSYFKDWFIVTGKSIGIKEVSLINERGSETLATSCSWKRKVTKHGWVNIYKAKSYRQDDVVADVAPIIYCEKHDADKNADSNRIACVYVEWEEEVD